MVKNPGKFLRQSASFGGRAFFLPQQLRFCEAEIIGQLLQSCVCRLVATFPPCPG
nr:MAG TPA: hypothetical protein [Caudoviricetes sp.]